MLDLFGGQNSDSLRTVVDAVPDFGDAAEGAFVVLGLEAEVSLAHDDDLGELEHGDGADAVDVSEDQLKLIGRLCVKI